MKERKHSTDQELAFDQSLQSIAGIKSREAGQEKEKRERLLQKCVVLVSKAVTKEDFNVRYKNTIRIISPSSCSYPDPREIIYFLLILKVSYR